MGLTETCWKYGTTSLSLRSESARRGPGPGIIGPGRAGHRRRRAGTGPVEVPVLPVPMAAAA